ncbi:MAG: relaxase/mobilization nuclease domain-containing protein [Synergistaceae bacterium]|jgi:hypothetical protein|nr:relaxase/mobilization nuclease domain-containing protein [Synergistaceae bacterium]
MVIAKIIPRKHGSGRFKDSVNYNLGLSRNDTDKVEYVNTLNIFAPEVAVAEMEALALENTRSADPVFNCILSWREHEIPTREQTDEAVGIVLKELGLEECLTHYALHRNTENLHLHVCVNRIDPETYKARDPAHGWTKKALEKAARKIEIAQGWEIERTGRYIVTENGEILEKAREDEKIKLSQTARDIEAHTGEKSAERIGQEAAAPIIRNAQSWEELHICLAEQGIAFECKGSGAVLHVGETVIKASQAGRDISLSKLEKRLGAYRDRDTFVLLHPARPEAVERVAAAPKVKGSWEEYRKAKAKYHAAKKDALSELQKWQGTERKILIGSQREERVSLFRVSWQGKGAELNQRRSLMAAKQQREKLDLRDRQKEEREKLKKRFPHQFPSFKTWLSLDDDPELSALYRYPGQFVLFAGGGEGTPAGERNFDLRDYFPVFGERRGGVMYRRNGSKRNTADFIDYGKKIVVSDKLDKFGVLAALQLASQKWGTVQLSGSEEYKRLCVQLATKHNIKLANPELKAEIEAARKSDAARINPEVGQRVTFRVHNSETKLTGKVVAIDRETGTVTLRAGRLTVPVITAKGYFTEAVPLEKTHTKEYACERAKTYVGENGFVFFARGEGIYRGPIMEATPTYVIQKTGEDTMTLHRRTDLKSFDEKLLGNQDVVIRKAVGMGIVCIEPRPIEKGKDKGWGR